MSSWKSPLEWIGTGWDGKFFVNEKTAQLVAKINQPLTVVAIAGLYRTGKSYLMNRLAGKSSGFALGSTVQSKTKGIWIWCIPHPRKRNETLVLIDTEGLGDPEKRNEEHDMTIFSLAVLLSSTFIFNAFGRIDQEMIDNLYFVTELTERVKVKSSTSDSEKGNSCISPQFVLAVRDFTLELIMDGKAVTPDDYFNHVMKLKKGKEEYNRPREAIRGAFRSHNCFVFTRPVEDERLFPLLAENNITESQLSSEFLQQSTLFVNFILRTSSVKKLDQSFPVNGSIFLTLSEEYVKAVNFGAIPRVESTATLVAQRENDRIVEQSVHLYEDYMETVHLPTSIETLKLFHDIAYKKAWKYFIKNRILDDDGQFFKKIVLMTEVYAKTVDENEQVSVTKCSNLINHLFESSIAVKLQERQYARVGGYRQYCIDIQELLLKYDAIPCKGVMAEEVRINFMRERTEGNAIMAADKQLRKKENEIEEAKNMKRIAEFEARSMEKKVAKKKRICKKLERNYQKALNGTWSSSSSEWSSEEWSLFDELSSSDEQSSSDVKSSYSKWYSSTYQSSLSERLSPRRQSLSGEQASFHVVNVDRSTVGPIPFHKHLYMGPTLETDRWTNVSMSHWPTVEVNHRPTVVANRWPTVEANRWPTVEANRWPTVEANRWPTVEANRWRTVEANRWPTVEANRWPTVEANRWPTVEANRWPTVEANRWPTVEANRWPTVEANRWPTVEANRWPTVELLTNDGRDHLANAVGDHRTTVCSDHWATVGHDRRTTIGSDHLANVGNDHLANVGNDRLANVTRDHWATISSDHRTNIGRDHGAAVSSDSRTTFCSEHWTNCGNDHWANVGRDHRSTFSSDQWTNVGNDHWANVGKNHWANIGSDHGATVNSEHWTNIGSDHRTNFGRDQGATGSSDQRTTFCSDNWATVGRDQGATISSDHRTTFCSDHCATVGTIRRSTIGSERLTNVGNDHLTNIGQDHLANVARNHSYTIGSDHRTNVGSVHWANVSSDHKRNVGRDCGPIIGGDHGATISTNHRATINSDHRNTVPVTIGPLLAVVIGSLLAVNMGPPLKSTD